MFKAQRNTKKATRAREMIAAIYHLNLSQVRNDRNGVQEIYSKLEALGFEWVADEQEWLNPNAVDPAKAQVMSFLVGSATTPIDEAAKTIVDGLEAMGYKILSTELMLDLSDPACSFVTIEVMK